MAPAKAKSNSKTRVSKQKSPPVGSKGKQSSPVGSPSAVTARGEKEVEAVLPDATERTKGRPKDDAEYKEADDSETSSEVEAAVVQHKKTSKKRKSTDETMDSTEKKWMERARRAERQLKVISKAQIINEFQDGEVRQYAKQVLWKKVKFITSDHTMVRCMKEAATAFEIKADSRQDWMLTYSHSVREAINAQRNHCCQELRKMVLSKWTRKGGVSCKQHNKTTI
jgi:hypothetical protein